MTGECLDMGNINPVRIKAEHWSVKNDGYECGLCPNSCFIEKGKFGKCGSRFGGEDFLVANTYGKVSSMCVDPVEKKPLYHFHPSSKIFSVGGIGCNLNCKHCQNYSISQSESGKKRATFKSPQEIVDACKSEKTKLVAFTYNEPSIWYEYIMDIIDLEPDFEYVLVTNGYISEKPLLALCKKIKAMNIDVKGFTDKFYKNVCEGSLENVLKTVKTVYEQNVHLELTYLIIPNHNDSEDELKNFVSWVKNNLSENIPVHFTRFHPDNNLNDVPWTPAETMEKALKLGKKAGLNYVYIGNMLSEDGSDTYCPHCGAKLVERTGYFVETKGLNGDRCASCKEKLYFVN